MTRADLRRAKGAFLHLALPLGIKIDTKYKLVIMYNALKHRK